MRSSRHGAGKIWDLGAFGVPAEGPNLKDVIQRNPIKTADGKMILEENERDILVRETPHHEYFDRLTDITTEFFYLPRPTCS